MAFKKYIPLLLIGCIILVVILAFSPQYPGPAGDNPAARVADLPKYPAENISTTVQTPRGTMIINAHVPESYQIMPVYRLNLSDRRTININRLSLPDTSGEKETILITSPLDNNQAEILAEKYLQQFHGLPDDAAVWKIEKTGNKIWTLPSVGDWVPLSTNHTRIIYTRRINEQNVDSWGISQEEEGLVTDHDYIKVGLREDGDLLYIAERWTRSEYVRNEPVINVTEALDRMKQWEHTNDDFGWLYDLKVQDIRQGYFENTGSTSIIEPAWFFSGLNSDGYNQTIVVLARKNDSSILPFYDGSHPDPSLPDWSQGYTDYKNWIKENYVNGTESDISMETAKDIVKKFSGNPNLVIENTIPFEEKQGCYVSHTIYNITTNEGVYTIDPKISIVRSVSYPVNIAHTQPNPVEYPQILKTSADYIHEKFGNYPVEDLAHNPDITEYPETYHVRITVANATILLDIDKKTGDVAGYTNANALPPEIC